MSLLLTNLAITIGVLSLVIVSAWYARRYSCSVADFLTANRCAGRYLLTVSQGIAGIGAISIIAFWEQFYQGGFGSIHWGRMYMPISLVLALSGWVVYRYRQTRAMTLAQFLEMRYSRRFRIFAGFLCFLSGALNYAIFPAVTGRFLISFLGLKVYATTLAIPGCDTGLTLNWTLGAVMALELMAALLITLNGGQVAVMVGDFVQGQLASILFLLLLVVLLVVVPWSELIETLKTAPADHSKLNPFHQGGLPDFSPWYFVMILILQVYGYRVWQGSQGYNASATSPHEAKMANVLTEFRGMIMFLLIPMAAIAAWVLLHGHLHPEQSAATQATLDSLKAAGHEQLAHQLTTTLAMKHLLPAGMVGLFTSVMAMAAVSTDSSYLHSWGTIFVQDVLMPIRQARGKPPLLPESHLRWLKSSIFAVAVFAWVFSMLFPVREYILMYFSATAAIFSGGAGAVLIGGLYWPQGNTRGAWVAMTVGSGLAVLGVLTINIFWPWLVPLAQSHYADVHWIQVLPQKFWLNGVQTTVVVCLISVACYVLVSLSFPTQPADFDKLFHRGCYQTSMPEGEPDYVPQKQPNAVPTWLRMLGMTEEFTAVDKLIFGMKYLWFFWEFIIGFVGITLAYTMFGLMRDDDSWAVWWTIYFWVTLVAGSFITAWFFIGGCRDLLRLFARLRSLQRDADDDGTVSAQNHVSSDESGERGPEPVSQ